MEFIKANDCAICPMTLELNALHGVSQALSHPQDVQQTLRKVLRELQDHGGMRHGMVTLLDPANG
jgi:transcriptional regulator with GAF, ATPase, and Fis domain